MAAYKATIMDEPAVLRALKRISHEILEKNNGSDDLVLVGIKRRGVPIAKIISENLKQIENVDIPVGEIDITYYRDDLAHDSSDPVIHGEKIDVDIKDKIVIMVDDVLYTGRTARAAMEALISCGRPSAIQLAVLVDRGLRELPIRGDFVGKNVPTSKTEIIKVKIPPFEDNLSVELFG